jgi:hypothetical protein
MQAKAERQDLSPRTNADQASRRDTPSGQAGFEDQRPQALTQRKMSDLADASPRMDRQRAVAGAIQRKADSAAVPDDSGLPEQLKSGIESLSGISMDGVKVHYNSSRPAQLNAHAYAQGSDIHIAPGQEKHLPHEAWHVVQQAQGRVKPTMQMRDHVPVNDDDGLEREADVMGARALSVRPSEEAPSSAILPMAVVQNVLVQRVALGIQSGEGSELDTDDMSAIANYVQAALERGNEDAITRLQTAVQTHDESKLEAVVRIIDDERAVISRRADSDAADGASAASAMPVRSVAEPVERKEPPPRRSYSVKAKELSAAAKRAEVSTEDIKELAEWLPEGASKAFNAFVATNDAFLAWKNLSCSADELIGFMKSEKSDDWVTSAKQKVEFDKAKARISTAKAKPAKKAVTFNTIVNIERYWVRSGKSVATSRSGGGMLLLKGITCSVSGSEVPAHISLPPNGDGSFSEGHLKIESGAMLNHYFFAIDASGKATTLANSPTVPTERPGNWDQIPGVWSKIKPLVERLATGEL